MALHCPECGFVNTDGANYCQKCGSFLGALEERAGGEPSTATYRIDETGELVPVDVEEVVAHEGAALVIRAGGGRVGESFALDHDRMTIGRRPDSDVFLDDVTVSRDHALLVKRGGDYYLDDLGLAQRHLRQPSSHRIPPPGGRRRAAGRQVQAHLPLAVTLMAVQDEPETVPDEVDRPTPAHRARR